MKLTIITIEPPFPPIHGGRVDVWRRLQAFATHGVRMQLICWYGNEKTFSESDIDEICKVCESIEMFPIKRDLGAKVKGVLKLPFQSIYLTGRELDPDERKRLFDSVEKFSPDAVWVESIFGSKLAIEIADWLDRKLFYRSQNIEFQYRQKQYQRAVGPRQKAMCWMSKRNLESFESMVFHRAEYVFDISIDDMAFWQDQGVTDISWLPPFIDEGLVNNLQRSTSEPRFDLAYLGNLYTPNNIEGILWFVKEVLPLIQKERKVTFLLSGSNPHPVIQKLEQTPGLKLLPNAASIVEVYQQSRVLINPILSGSGMNVKSVEMLFSGKSVVTTKQGVAGFPPGIATCFKAATEAREFAQLCLTSLAELQPSNCSESKLVDFRPEAINQVIDQIRFRISR